MAYAYQKTKKCIHPAKLGNPSRACRICPWYIGYKNELGGVTQEKSLAPNKAEAEKEAAEKERQADRVRRGEAKAAPAPTTFGAWADTYIEKILVTQDGEAQDKSRIKKHLKPAFEMKLLEAITVADVEDLLAAKARTEANPKGLGQTSCEHLRRLLRRMFNRAIARNLMRANPAAQAKEVNVDEAAVRYLQIEEIATLLAHAPPEWVGIFAVAAYCGLRAGEIRKLKRAQVDMGARIMQLSKTKNGRARAVPLPMELMPYLKVEMARGRSEFLFPNPKGGMLPKHTKFFKAVQETAIQAGLVVGYDHICGKRTCKHVERRADPAPRPCPECFSPCRVEGVAKDVIFKDFRSSYGTHAAEATSDVRFVQKAMGQLTPEMAERYLAVRDRRLVAQGDKLSFAAFGSDSLPATYPALTRVQSAPHQLFPDARQTLEVTAKIFMRDEGVEPTTFGSGGQRVALTGTGSNSHPLADIANSPECNSQALASITAISHPRTYPALTDLRANLFPNEVAERLRVSAATVRGWCRSGHMKARKVGAKFLISEEDLAEFLERSRGGPR